jgi:NAD(P)-dependent dehydrogenase (short-subunit alcohol dehydrogenase family)
MNEKAVIAVVTSSSTGIGFETSLLLARNGFYTYATKCIHYIFIYNLMMLKQ